MTVPFQAIPNGWFCVATTRELKPGRVLEKRYFEREWVLWRTASGAPVMSDAYCPHLGAHLGGGKICGDHLRCPFHGFEYARDGACVATPDGRTPPRARLRSLPLLERQGVVLAYWHAEGEEPTWEPPALDEPDYTAYAFRRSTFRGHPQEICENSSDLVHFGPTHGYGNARTTSEPRVDGHVLRVDYAMDRSLDFLGMPRRRAALAFSAEVFGLGFSRVCARLPSIDVQADLLVMPTPIDAETVELNFAARVRRWKIPFLTPLLRPLFVRGYTSDLMADVPIWSRKRYVARPALTEGEQPITIYRKFAAQFYSQPPEPKPLAPVMRAS
ncbi:MAG TPA: Rieske 2Fe-2S domain-containing protein [Myxococcota bacterium]|nr:Rieske 2Fe-2S domain-containing protein [Myxococcota bacterium]